MYHDYYVCGFFMSALKCQVLYILQRGVQWKQGVAIYIMLYVVLLHDTTPIHCTPPPTTPPFDEYPV